MGKQKVVPKKGRTTKDQADHFHALYADKDESAEERKKSASDMVDIFYDVTHLRFFVSIIEFSQYTQKKNLHILHS